MIKHSPAGPAIENPMIKSWSTTVGEDKAYMRAWEAIKEQSPCKTLPQDDEAYKMGGEWASLSLLEGTNLIVADESRIYIPKAAREDIINSMHTSHSKGPSMATTIRLSYDWPRL